LVPVTETTNVVAQKPMDAKEKAKEEEETRVFTVTLVADYIKRIE
jgi:hypothetical protein